MATASTARIGWLEMFSQRRAPNGFLQRHFTAKPGSQFNGDEVEIDIQRFGEQVACVVKKGSGPKFNDADVYTTKKFKPPAYNEAVAMEVEDLVARMAGVDPYSAAYTDYASSLVAQLVRTMGLLDDKIKRAIELQASQILQTGILTLIDESGATVYSLDFSPKAAHFPTVGTSWANPAADALGDLASLARLIRSNGKVQASKLIFGDNALKYFLANTGVKDVLDNRRMMLGQVDPKFADAGATHYGDVWAGSYRFEMWSYPDLYAHPQTGTLTPYVGTDKVIMLSDATRLDRVSAYVPLPLGPDPRVASFVPGRMQSPDFDVVGNAYCSPNGKQIVGELETRTLLVPTQIDGFGCLDVVP